MSRRTAEANKAIAAAWGREKQLVIEGKGTRDWTPQQQKDICEKGKAYSDDGKSFEGHHMMSVAAYPEYQGEAENIQFLSRTEHISAHSGNTGNPTNGYYDPVTRETKKFSENKPVVCRVVKLTSPIAGQLTEEELGKTTKQRLPIGPDDKPLPPRPRLPIEPDGKPLPPRPRPPIGPDGKPLPPRPRPPVGPDDKPLLLLPCIPELDNKSSQEGVANKVSLVSNVANFFGYKTKTDFFIDMIQQLIEFASDLAFDQVSKQVSKRDNNNSNSKFGAYDNRGNIDDTVIMQTSINVGEPSEKRTSPTGHTVPRHGQHYNTKEGRVWREKEPYPRGKNQ